VALFGKAKEMLDEGEYNERLGAELLRTGAGLGICGSFLAFDAGELALARRLCQEAALLADSTEDALLRAHVYVTMAVQSTSLARISGRRGPAREALRALGIAKQVAKHEPSPKLHALINMRAAPAAALLGDATAAQGAITQARRELDRKPFDEEPVAFGFVTPTEILGHEARVFADLGKPARAVDLYTGVLEDPVLPARNRALYTGLTADSQLTVGDATGALERGHGTLDLLDQGVNSRRTLNTLRPLTEQDPDFRERFAAVARSLVAE
jgi:ATP/maltotriose-dependent transcriptional regulator MalT